MIGDHYEVLLPERAMVQPPMCRGWVPASKGSTVPLPCDECSVGPLRRENLPLSLEAIIDCERCDDDGTVMVLLAEDPEPPTYGADEIDALINDGVEQGWRHVGTVVATTSRGTEES